MTVTSHPTNLTEALRETARLMASKEERLGRSYMPASGIRRLAWQAVYGDLWHPDRVGEVPPEQRPALRALVKQVINRVCPGGAYARGCSAADVLAMAEEDD